MPDLFYFNRHFHSMQAGIPVVRKTGTCYNNGNGNVKNSFQIKSREGERIWSYGRPF